MLLGERVRAHKIMSMRFMGIKTGEKRLSWCAQSVEFYQMQMNEKRRQKYRSLPFKHIEDFCDANCLAQFPLGEIVLNIFQTLLLRSIVRSLDIVLQRRLTQLSVWFSCASTTKKVDINQNKMKRKNFNATC